MQPRIHQRYRAVSGLPRRVRLERRQADTITKDACTAARRVESGVASAGGDNTLCYDCSVERIAKIIINETPLN